MTITGSLIMGPEEKCDFTGEKIKHIEPRIVIKKISMDNGIYSKNHRYTIKYSKTDDFLNRFEGKSKKKEVGEKIIKCPHDGDEYILESERGIDLYGCQECYNKICDIVRSSREKMNDIKYWSDSGLYVRDLNEEKQSILDNGKIEGCALVIGNEETEQAFLRLEKIVEFRNIINDTGRYIEINGSLRKHNCILCRKNIEGGHSVLYVPKLDGTSNMLHLRCLHSLMDELNLIIEQENDYIVSRNL